MKELEEIKVSEEKMKNNQKPEESAEIEEEVLEEVETKEPEELTIDDFIEDFKL